MDKLLSPTNKTRRAIEISAKYAVVFLMAAWCWKSVAIGQLFVIFMVLCGVGLSVAIVYDFFNYQLGRILRELQKGEEEDKAKRRAAERERLYKQITGAANEPERLARLVKRLQDLDNSAQ